jgi:thiol-disulfide isomerase/thioredoxin
MIQAQFYGAKLAYYMNPFTDAEKQEISDLFRDKPIYAETLIAESDRIELILTATKDNQDEDGIMNELPDVSQEQMLDAIIAKYKGKVVVVDIWGTWCHYCMRDIKTNIPPFKEEMKGKDVVWVYIADGTTPLDTWKKTYSAIPGEHYYVSREQTNYWGVNSYPTYMVYDRQGKQLTRFIDFSKDAMKTAIEKGL